MKAQFFKKRPIDHKTCRQIDGTVVRWPIYSATEEGTLLRQFRNRHKIGIRKAAAVIGIPVATLSAIEIGKFVFMCAADFEELKRRLERCAR